VSADASLPPTARLLRVLKNKPLHVHPIEQLPTPLAFDPSSADLAHVPVRVSVWDADRVPFARAKELRGGGDLVGFVLTAGDVATVAVQYEAPGLRAVEDPAGAVGCTPEEARWHYGIEGLEKTAWKDREARLKALRRLALACTLAT